MTGIRPAIFLTQDRRGTGIDMNVDSASWDFGPFSVLTHPHRRLAQCRKQTMHYHCFHNNNNNNINKHHHHQQQQQNQAGTSEESLTRGPHTLRPYPLPYTLPPGSHGAWTLADKVMSEAPELTASPIFRLKSGQHNSCATMCHTRRRLKVLK